MKSKIIDILLIALLIYLGLAITLPRAGNAIWHDEAYTVDLVKTAPSEVMILLAQDKNMPAYYFFMKAWTAVFGFGEVPLRAPSIIFYILSALFVYLFGKRLFPGRGPGFVSAVFYLLMFITTSHAVNARAYSMLAFLCMASLWLFYEIFIAENKNRLLTAVFIAVNITGTLTHVWFFFAGAGQVIFYLVAAKKVNKKFLSVFAASFLTFFAVYGGFFFRQLSNKSTDWMEFKGDELLSTLRSFTAFKFSPMALLLCIPALAVFFTGKSARKRKKTGPQENSPFFLAVIILVSLLIPYIISVFKPIYDPGRGPIIAAAPFALLCGYLASISYKPLFYSFFTLFAVFMCVRLYSFDEVDYYNAKTLARIVMNFTERSDKTAIYGEVKREILYYLNFYNFREKGRIFCNPDLFDYARLELNGKTDELKRRELDEKFVQQLDAGNGRLVFIFNENEKGVQPFDKIYSELNLSRKIMKKGFFCGTVLVMYE